MKAMKQIGRMLMVGIAVVGIAMMTIGCQKKEVKALVGSYSYKTSSVVELTTDTTTASVKLRDEIGQLYIEGIGKSDSVVIAITPISGSVATTKAKVSGNDIILVPFTHNITLIADSSEDEDEEWDWSDLFKKQQSDITENCEVKVSGTGKRYNELIIFTLQYEGETSKGTVKLKSKSVEMVANRN